MEDALARAVRLLNERRFGDAVAALRQRLTLVPADPVAMTLLAVGLMEQQDFDGAERALATALAIQPGRPEILLRLAQVVRRAGRPEEAVAHCRAVLDHTPDQEEALAELAAAQHAAGAFEAAVDVLRRSLAGRPTSIDLHRALAASLVRLERSDEAEQVLRAALALAPLPSDQGTPEDVHLDLGDLLKGRRAFAAALDHYGHAGSRMRTTKVAKARATALQHLHRFDEAVAALHSAVAHDPLDLDAHLQLNELLYRQGRDGEFLRSYDEAAARVPGAGGPLIAKGRLLLKAGRAAAAYDCFRDALKRVPGDAGALIGCARALDALDMTAEARQVYEWLLRERARDAGVLVDAAAFLLRRGEEDRALGVAERALAAAPIGQEAPALLSLCYRALGSEREFALADHDRLVGIFDLPPPAGYADMPAFNRELARYLDGLHGDAREHFTQTLRGGTRIFDTMFGNGHALAERLRPVIDGAIAQYLREVPTAAPPLFTDRVTGAFRFVSSWSSQFGQGGYHQNHIHPDGWISAVYYVAVPAACADAAAQEGWLKFGEPTIEFGTRFGPRRLVEPRPGRLVLFPSYLWHGTTRLRTAEPRMTIAFDVAPAPRPGSYAAA